MSNVWNLGNEVLGILKFWLVILYVYKTLITYTNIFMLYFPDIYYGFTILVDSDC